MSNQQHKFYRQRMYRKSSLLRSVLPRIFLLHKLCIPSRGSSSRSQSIQRHKGCTRSQMLYLCSPWDRLNMRCLPLQCPCWLLSQPHSWNKMQLQLTSMCQPHNLDRMLASWKYIFQQYIECMSFRPAG